MMGNKTLAEIKAQLRQQGFQLDGDSLRAKPTVEADRTDFEKMLFQKLAELEREVEKLRKPLETPAKGQERLS